MPQDLYSNLLFNGAIGLVIGCYGTLIGAGGGFLLVPVLLLAHGLPHSVAVGTSLAVVALNAFSGTVGYLFQRKIDYRSGLIFALATVPGAMGGAWLTGLTSGPVFMRLLGLLLLGISLYLFFRQSRAMDGGSGRHKFHLPTGIGISMGVGVISSWFGIGGGILHVPAMTEILRFPVHVAVATSQFVLFWTALVGVGIHAMKANVDLQLVAPLGVGAVLGAQLGARIAHRLKGAMVLRYLSLALLFVGIRLLFF